MIEERAMTADDEAMQQRNAVIAQQNDRFPQTWGADFTIPGQIVSTQGIAAEPVEWRVALMVAVMRFSAFTADNDPYGDHTFAGVDVTFEGETKKVFWKIDLYDNDLKYGSEEPENPKVTTRVMTLMFPHEY